MTRTSHERLQQCPLRRDIKDKTGKVIRKYHMPSHAHLMVQDGESVEAGDVIATIPRETTKVQGPTSTIFTLDRARRCVATVIVSVMTPLDAALERIVAVAKPDRVYAA